jgi:hypothetical protein
MSLVDVIVGSAGLGEERCKLRMEQNAADCVARTPQPQVFATRRFC